jgi:adenylate cyclase
MAFVCPILVYTHKVSFFEELKRRNVFRVGVAYAIASWVLLQVADLVLEAIAAPAWVLQALMLVVGLGFIVALIIAWAYELTPEGIKRESEVDRSQSITGETGHKLDRIIISFLAAAVVILLAERFINPQDTENPPASQEIVANETSESVVDDPVLRAPEKSIAVLPFTNMSDDASNEFFADGISEEILNVLAQVKELKVAGRTSAFAFKGQNQDLREIGEALGVNHVLEGSVRKAGNKVRVTAQLIQVSDGFHLWSNTWDRTLDNIFVIQDEIAAAVVEQLEITLLDNVPHAKETDSDAYSLFLQARHFSNLLSPEGWEQSIPLYKAALEIAPDYALAWSGLGRDYINLAGYNLLPPAEGYGLAREAVAKALAIDPDTATAHAALGWISLHFDGDLEAAAKHFERALELDPNDLGMLRNAATFSYALGRMDDAIALGEYSLARDPVNPSAYFNLTHHYTVAGQYEKAIEMAQHALRLNPGMPGANYYMGESLLRLGKPEQALEAFKRETDDEWRVKGMALAFFELGRQPEFEEKFTKLKEGWMERWPIEIAHVYAWTGQIDEVFPLLQKDIEINGPGGVIVDPFFTSLHGDPRWSAMLESAGISKVQLDRIEFHVDLAD